MNVRKALPTNNVQIRPDTVCPGHPPWCLTAIFRMLFLASHGTLGRVESTQLSAICICSHTSEIWDCSGCAFHVIGFVWLRLYDYMRPHFFSLPCLKYEFYVVNEMIWWGNDAGRSRMVQARVGWGNDAGKGNLTVVVMWQIFLKKYNRTPRRVMQWFRNLCVCLGVG